MFGRLVSQTCPPSWPDRALLGKTRSVGRAIASPLWSADDADAVRRPQLLVVAPLRRVLNAGVVVRDTAGAELLVVRRQTAVARAVVAAARDALAVEVEARAVAVGHTGRALAEGGEVVPVAVLVVEVGPRGVRDGVLVGVDRLALGKEVGGVAEELSTTVVSYWLD